VNYTIFHIGCLIYKDGDEVMRIGKDYIGVGCGAFILNENGELLLQKRNKEPEKGWWSIPGGRVEMFDTFKSTIKREVKEETDLDIEIVKTIGICDHIVDMVEEEKVHWVSPNFLCRVVSGKAKIMEPTKHAEMGWFSLNELPSMLTIPTKKALEDYEENDGEEEVL